MKQDYKPQGYNSVSVYIMADKPQAVINFLRDVFGAELMRRYEYPDGSIMHAEVKVDDTVVMIATASKEYPAFPVWLHVYVPDVDSAYRRALDVGGKSIQEPKVQEGDPDRRGAVADPAGNIWWLATQAATG
jgi:uncharacterized glyoxalase superfamily protein PhnB